MIERILLLLIIGLLFTLASPFFLWKGAVGVYYSSRAIDWPSTEGVIESTDFVTEKDRTFQGPEIESTDFSVSYRYFVDGQEYEGTRVRFGSINRNGSQNHKDRMKYFRERKVPVYYDPDNPSISVLDQSFNYTSFIDIGIAIVFFPLGVFMVRKYFKGSSSREEESHVVQD